jgi:16S rRNA (guanine527-N7)-methyltransferase
MKLGSTQWKAVVVEGLKTFGIPIDARQTDQFARHAIELIHWNQRMNLTAITDPFEIAVKHYIDSVAVLPMIPKDNSILDIGSGGGFPGIPIKILCPAATVTLIDASQKKISFLKHIIRTLDLKGIGAIHIRAEKLAQTCPFLKRFDVVICRAVSALNQFVIYAKPLITDKGTMIALKGQLTSEEIEQAKTVSVLHSQREMNGKPEIFINCYRLPFLGSSRSIVRIGFK